MSDPIPMMPAAGTNPENETLGGLLDAARSAERALEWDEALARYEEAFTLVRAEGTPRDAADILRWIGNVRRQQEDLDAAEELFEASVAVAEASGERLQIAQGLNCLGIVAFARRDLDTAQDLYGRAYELALVLDEELLAAMTGQNLAVIANIRGQAAVALERYTKALRIYRKLDDAPKAIRCLNNMGMAHVDLEEFEAAAACYDQASGMAVEADDLDMVATVAVNRAELILLTGRYEAARESCDRAFELFGRLGSTSGQAEAYKLYGALYRETGKLHLADASLADAIMASRACGDLLLEAEAERERSLVHLAAGRNADALRCLNRSHGIFQQLRAQQDLLGIDQRLDRLEDTFLRVVKAWGESIESKDRYTAGHCGRVADYACRLAELAGLCGRDLTWFRMGAFLHDVGKTVVPEEVLNKPGKLDADEWAVMQSHTTVGDAIVAELNFPWDVRPIVRSHHERWDGSGYPDGLRGTDIPLVARILAIADVFDALTTARSYRAAMSVEDALEIMTREAGQALDAELFALFRTTLDERTPTTPGGLRIAS